MAEHKSIYTALVAAQQEFGVVKKGSVNPAFKSKYADLADVASVVIPTLSQHGVAVLHYMVGENLNAMRTEFVHAASETRVSCDVPLIVDRQNMQGMKSAVTYAKRVGLESLSGIAPEDDDGNAAAAAPPRKTPRFVTSEQVQEIVDLVDEVGADHQGFLKYLGVTDITQLPADKYGAAIAALNRKKVAK